MFVLACPECRDPARRFVFQGDTGSHVPAPDYDTTLSIDANAQFQKLVSSLFYYFLCRREREGEKSKGFFGIRAT